MDVVKYVRGREACLVVGRGTVRLAALCARGREGEGTLPSIEADVHILGLAGARRPRRAGVEEEEEEEEEDEEMEVEGGLRDASSGDSKST